MGMWGMIETARRWAVLIDAENVPAAVADPLFARATGCGAVGVRRLYGNLTTGANRAWLAIAGRLGLDATHQIDLAAGKNAADIAMVIDAMDLLHRGWVGGFWLVSSDSDFTRLARRIRDQGLPVHGVGRAGAPQALRVSCTEFVAIEELLAPACWLHRDAVPLIERAMAACGPADWHHLGPLGQAIKRLDPAFTPQRYGCARLSGLVRATGAFRERRRADNAIEIARN